MCHVSSCDLRTYLFPVHADVLEGRGVVDGKDEQEALPRTHVLVAHSTVDTRVHRQLLSRTTAPAVKRSPVLLLTCGVQDVQETGLAVYYYLFPVRVFYSWIIFVDEVVLNQLNR